MEPCDAAVIHCHTTCTDYSCGEQDESYTSEVVMQSPELKHHFAAPFSHAELVRARGVLVVHDRPELFGPLMKMSFMVFPLPHDVNKEEIGPLLAHRVLVSDSVDLYREAAAIYEFSIIDIANYDHDAPSLAGEISRLWMKLGLKHKQGFVLSLRREGEPSFEEVE